jgi:hypothetical protein
MQTRLTRSQGAKRVIENSGQCVSARYDVQILTIPAPSGVRQVLDCVTSGSTCRGWHIVILLTGKSLTEHAKRMHELASRRPRERVL